MVPELQTARLILCPISLDDAPQIQLLFSHWEMVKYLNSRVPWPYPADGALTFIREYALPAKERGESWSWTIRLKSEPGTVIGCIEFLKGEDTNRGFWLGQEWHGQGFMTEACDAVTDYWFHTLKMPLLRVPKAVANVASRKISVHQGMRVVREEMRDYVSGRHPSEVWEITREEWQARKTRRP